MSISTPPSDFCSVYENTNTQYCIEEAQRAADTAFVSALVVNAFLFLVFFVMFLIFYHVSASHIHMPPQLCIKVLCLFC